MMNKSESEFFIISASFGKHLKGENYIKKMQCEIKCNLCEIIKIKHIEI